MKIVASKNFKISTLEELINICQEYEVPITIGEAFQIMEGRKTNITDPQKELTYDGECCRVGFFQKL